MDATYQQITKVMQEIEGRLTTLNHFCETFRNTADAFRNEFETIRGHLDAVRLELEQGRDAGNHERAFPDALARIKKILAVTPSKHIKIQIIAVSARYCWNWLTKDLRALLEAFPSAQCSIHLLLVHPDIAILQRPDLRIANEEWSVTSRSRTSDLSQFSRSLPESLGNRFRIELQYYRNLPHWHGIYIDDAHLFLGRCKWDGTVPSLRLTVGENEYREFDRTGQLGVDRIDLFEGWFKLYSMIGEVAENPSKFVSH